MRIVFISDTHSLHEKIKFNLSDYIDTQTDNILLHTGDCTNMGRPTETQYFLQWYNEIDGFDKKFLIAGNHDFYFEIFQSGNMVSNFGNIIYLKDEEFVYSSKSLNRNIKLYGSPWQPLFYNWAFNLPRNGKELEKVWAKIPDDTDILLTLSPPFGFCDLTDRGESVGCELLRNRVLEIKPIISCFGHIHNAYGVTEHQGTTFVNAAICTEQYQPTNRPIIFDLTNENGQIKLTQIKI